MQCAYSWEYLWWCQQIQMQYHGWFVHTCLFNLLSLYKSVLLTVCVMLLTVCVMLLTVCVMLLTVCVMLLTVCVVNWVLSWQLVTIGQGVWCDEVLLWSHQRAPSYIILNQHLKSSLNYNSLIKFDIALKHVNSTRYLSYGDIYNKRPSLYLKTIKYRAVVIGTSWSVSLAATEFSCAYANYTRLCHSVSQLGKMSAKAPVTLELRFPTTMSVVRPRAVLARS